MLVHGNLESFKALVKKQVLYNMSAEIDENAYVKCVVFSVSSYVGSVPTFQIMVEDQSIFSYVPPHLLSVGSSILSSDDDSFYDLKDVVYHNCPDVEFTVVVLEYLKRPLSVYLKGPKIWSKAEYLFTMDWYRGNDLMHCVVLSNGQLGFFPSHKISFGAQEVLSYLKLKYEWKV